MILGGGFPLITSDIATGNESATILARAIVEAATRSAEVSWQQEFSWIAVGLGALGFGFGGKLLSSSSLEALRLFMKQRILKHRYPTEQLNKSYHIWGVLGKNEWWLVDIKRKTRHHILPYRTVEILGWEGKRENVTEKLLNQYGVAEKIDASKI